MNDHACRCGRGDCLRCGREREQQRSPADRQQREAPRDRQITRPEVDR